MMSFSNFQSISFELASFSRIFGSCSPLDPTTLKLEVMDDDTWIQPINIPTFQQQLHKIMVMYHMVIGINSKENKQSKKIIFVRGELVGEKKR